MIAAIMAATARKNAKEKTRCVAAAGFRYDSPNFKLARPAGNQNE
jgi:hypothetical protein